MRLPFLPRRRPAPTAPTSTTAAGGRVHHQCCHLCEASCGIRITTDAAGAITDVRGDDEDPFSRGYVCPKVMGLVDVHTDPDRLRTPLVKRDRAGGFEPIGWDEAFDLVAARLRAIRREHGPDALAVYQGNPTAHNFGLLTFGQLFLRRLGTKNLYSATSADQLPHMLSSLLMFGHQLLMPVPDLDRTDYLLVVGGNPAVSNGSLMTAPDIRRRFAELRARGGQIVVVDPRRTETARLADRHIFIRPGTDALLLLGVLHTLHAEGLARPGRLAALADGEDELRRAAADFAPERVAGATGVPAGEIRRLARELAAAPSAAAYGRVGSCTQEFGGLTSWLINLVNYTTGNLDRAGGAMFSSPPVDLLGAAARAGMRGSFDSYQSRVRGLPEFGGELPVAALAEEIETPGEGRIRALLTSAGNPVLSTPNGARLERALPSLDFMVAIDFYVNETTRHADVILPPTFALERDHFEAVAFLVSVRNGARAWRALYPRGPEQRHDWEICLELASRMQLGERGLGGAGAALLRRFGRRVGPRGIAALGLRMAPHRPRGGHGDGERAGRGGRLSLAAIESAPHGIDLGPLEPRLPDALYTPERRIDLAPRAYLDDLARLRGRWQGGGASMPEDRPLLLIGRRQLRSNNSWLHNSRRLVKGKPRCTLLVHPDDAERLGLREGGHARVRSRVGEATVPVEVSDDIMPGVVSLPHGWGHGRPGIGLQVAAAHPGASINDLTDEEHVDRLSGTCSFSGVPVAVEAALSAALPVPEARPEPLPQPLPAAAGQAASGGA
ncbi:MAG TPA: molybdopterin oxidoreductase family protein [Kofleriaceae bacterium]|nr:molybdopterin oxidoreductase family protein [Kofleriaceae bacterium]